MKEAGGARGERGHYAPSAVSLLLRSSSCMECNAVALVLIPSAHVAQKRERLHPSAPKVAAHRRHFARIPAARTMKLVFLFAVLVLAAASPAELETHAGVYSLCRANTLYKVEFNVTGVPNDNYIALDDPSYVPLPPAVYM